MLIEDLFYLINLIELFKDKKIVWEENEIFYFGLLK